jgi:hypothetical protein
VQQEKELDTYLHAFIIQAEKDRLAEQNRRRNEAALKNSSYQTVSFLLLHIIQETHGALVSFLITDKEYGQDKEDVKEATEIYQEDTDEQGRNHLSSRRVLNGIRKRGGSCLIYNYCKSFNVNLLKAFIIT